MTADPASSTSVPLPMPISPIPFSTNFSPNTRIPRNSSNPSLSSSTSRTKHNTPIRSPSMSTLSSPPTMSTRVLSTSSPTSTASVLGTGSGSAGASATGSGSSFGSGSMANRFRLIKRNSFRRDRERTPVQPQAISPIETLTTTGEEAFNPILQSQQPPETFPFADFPIEPSSPTSVIKRRRWVRPSDRSPGEGAVGGMGICGPSNFAARMAALRPLRPCLVSRRRYSAGGSGASASASTNGSGGGSCLPTPDEYSAGGLLSSSLGAGSPGGLSDDTIWNPALPSPPFGEGGFQRGYSFSALSPEVSKADGVIGMAVIAPIVVEDEHSEVEEYMLKGLYGTKPIVKPVDLPIVLDPIIPIVDIPESTTQDKPIESPGVDILSCSETSTIMPSSSFSLPSSTSRMQPYPNPTSTSTTQSHAHPSPEEEPEYMCEYEYLFAISAYNAAASARGVAEVATSSSEGSKTRSRSSTASGLSGSDGEEGRPRRKVHFPMAPERLGEIALCSLYPTYSPFEYDRTPLEPPSEQERSCRLPARGSRCFLDEVDVIAIDGPIVSGTAGRAEASPDGESGDETEDGCSEGVAPDADLDSGEVGHFEMDAVDSESPTPKPSTMPQQGDDDAWEDWLDQRQKKSPKPACSPSMALGGTVSRFGDVDGLSCSPSAAEGPSSSSRTSRIPPPALSLGNHTLSRDLDYVDFKVPSPKQLTFDELCKEEDIEGIVSDTPSLASTLTATSTCQSSLMSKPDLAAGITSRLDDVDLGMAHEERETWLPHAVAKPSPTEEQVPVEAESDHNTPTKPFKKPGKKGKRKNAFCRASTWANRLGNFSAEELGFGSSSSGFGTPEDDGVLGGF